MAAESALFAPQTGLSFHAWLFLGGVFTQEYVCWLGFPIKRNTFDRAYCPPRNDPRSNNQTMRMRDVIRKWSIAGAGGHVQGRIPRGQYVSTHTAL